MSLLNIVETAYRLNVSEPAWLQSIANAALPDMNEGHGVVAVPIYRAPGKAPTFTGDGPRSAGVPDDLQRQFLMAFSKVPEQRKDKAMAILPCSTLSEALGEGEAFRNDPVAREYLQPFGVFDVRWITVADPAGYCLALGIGLPEVGRTSASKRSQYGRLGAHLTAAFRLRRRLFGDAPGQELPDGDALLRPDGRIEDARGSAATPIATAALRAAVIALDRVRHPARADEADEPLCAWQTLVAACWSLVDTFESDGRRYIVAHPNDPATSGMPTLTDRERLVVQYVALGHSNKFIGYELGLSASTVAVYFKRAAHKLGVRSRLELIGMFAKGSG